MNQERKEQQQRKSIRINQISSSEIKRYMYNKEIQDYERIGNIINTDNENSIENDIEIDFKIEDNLLLKISIILINNNIHSNNSKILYTNLYTIEKIKKIGVFYSFLKKNSSYINNDHDDYGYINALINMIIQKFQSKNFHILIIDSILYIGFVKEVENNKSDHTQQEAESNQLIEKNFNKLMISKRNLLSFYEFELFLYDNNIDSTSLSIKETQVLFLQHEISKEYEINEELHLKLNQILGNLDKENAFNSQFFKKYSKFSDFFKLLNENSLCKVNLNAKTQLKNMENSVILLKKDILLNDNSLFKPILKHDEKELLKEWFNNKEFLLYLIYDSMSDGSKSIDFHKKCDGKLQTIVFYETLHGRRFGGYSKYTWDNIYNNNEDKDETGNKIIFKKSEENFIFSLDKKRKFLCKNTDKAVQVSSNLGPSFGDSDIICADDFTNNQSCSKLSCYNDIEIEETYKDKIFSRRELIFAGIEKFYIKRVETYQVVFK